MRRKLKLATVLLTFVYLMVNNTIPTFTPLKNDSSYAVENDEIRAVWVSTVFGLDFPKMPTSSSESLKAELDEIINNTKTMSFNTIFFQARPSSDAFYKSDIYSWSKYLTGTYGNAPDSGFDPLEYLVSEAHKNNISVHAWINPYRITASAEEKDRLSENSIAKLHPDWVIDYNGKLYLNPGLPEVNDFIAEGAAEIAEKYDVDGIQIDDYFYPGADFPDDRSYSVYGKGYTDKDSWRRDNITSLINKISAAVKKTKPKIIFSVSPQGIWANAENMQGGSDTNGKEAYYSSYADTLKWVKENNIDYIIPQIYWNIGYAGADFKILLDWWSKAVEGTKVKLIIGQAAYKVSEATDAASVWYGERGAEEIRNQTDLCREKKNVAGYAMFRYSNLSDTPALKNVVTECNLSGNEVFRDIISVEWAKADITELYEKGIVNGISDRVFAPYDKVTRGQFAVMISRILNKKAEFTDNFSDVSPDKYYYEHIGILKKLGLIQGKSETEFDPDSSISRQDMATIVYRILLKEQAINEVSAGAFSYTDSYDIKDYAKDAVYAMSENKLLTGYEDGSFKPCGDATRAECSVFLNRVCRLLNK